MLLVVQMTLSVMLLAGAGMFGGSLYRVLSQDFGMEMRDVLLVNARVGPDTAGGMARAYRDALERIRQLPDVEMATVINTIPFSGFNVPPIFVTFVVVKFQRAQLWGDTFRSRIIEWNSMPLPSTFSTVMGTPGAKGRMCALSRCTSPSAKRM